MKIRSLDHLVLTVKDLDKTVAFYRDLLHMELVSFHHQGTGKERFALKFGSQKMNLHPADNIPDANVKHPTPGSADLCFIVEDSVEELARGQYACHQQLYVHLPIHRLIIDDGVHNKHGTTSVAWGIFPQGEATYAVHLIVNQSLLAELEGHGVKIILGPCQRTGATAPLLSIYVYDPDENLIELSNIK